MFVDGAKDIVSNSMHARIPNLFLKKNQWLNLCIDVQSFVNECFSKPTAQQTPITEKNLFKCIESIQLDGQAKIRKIFSSRS
jgi:hypothetical protein